MPNTMSNLPPGTDRGLRLLYLMKAVVIWLIAIAPLAWGVTKSVQKSLPLFGIEAPAAR